METALKTNFSDDSVKAPRVVFSGDVLQQIRQHARSSMSAEICGVLIGKAAEGVTHVTARIAGEGATQGGAHVTFTQDTWQHIYKVKDAEFSSQSIVGWYHSHPGFGIFLSDYDLFIHENFFGAQHQVAWVFDPHSDEEGCFGWVAKKVEPLPEVTVIRKHRPPASEQAQEEGESREAKISKEPSGRAGVEKNRNARRRPSRLAVTVLIGILSFACGFAFHPYFTVLKGAISAVFRRPTQPMALPPPAAPTATPVSPKSEIIGVDPSGQPLPKEPAPGTPPAPPQRNTPPTDGTDNPSPITSPLLNDYPKAPEGGTTGPKTLPLPAEAQKEQSREAPPTPQAEKPTNSKP